MAHGSRSFGGGGWPGRRRAPAAVAAVLAVVLAWLGALPAPARPGPAQPSIAAVPVEQPPNVLILLSDDQAWSTFNRRLMPAVHGKIVDRGALFRRAYVNTPQCCPSRSELLTGLYQHHTGVAGNATPLHRPTIVNLLHDRGYRTMLAGKYLNSAPCDPRPEFDRWVCSSVERSSYSLVDPTLNVDGEWRSFAGPTGAILADLTARFVHETSPERPFFALFAPTSPHLPANEPRHRDLAVFPRRSPSFDEDTVAAGKPAYLRRGPLTAGEVAGVDTRWRSMSRAVRALDDDVATVLGALGDRADDTLVFYLSDNGYLYGDHRRWEKDVPYEEAVRVPFAVRWPAVLPAAQRFTTKSLVGNVDVAPTIADALGLPWTGDGRSLLPILTRGAQTVRRSFLLETCQPTAALCPGNQPGLFGMVTVPAYNAVVTWRWKYIEYVTGERELYDLSADPAELRNLAEAPSYDGTRSRLAATLRDLRAPPPIDTTIVEGPLGANVDARSFLFSFFSQPLDASYRCRMTRDGLPGEWRDCSEGSLLVGPLADAEYAFEVAGASAGTADPTPAVRAFSIHTAGTPVFLDEAPPRQGRDRSVAFSFSSSGVVDGFECSLQRYGEPGPWEACSSPWQAGPLEDGLWSFRVRALAGGRWTAPPAQWLFRVDNAGPVAVLSDRPPPSTSLTWAYFAFRMDEPTSGPVRCTLDARPSADCANGTFGASGLSEGTHSLVVEAVDEIGNAGGTRTEWTVDLTAPSASITGGPRANWPLRGATFTMTSTEPGAFYCRLDDLPRHACGSPVSFQGLSEGPHVFTAWAWDRALNASSPVTWSWIQDTATPVLEGVRVVPDAFSPNGDGRADRATLRAPASEPAKWFLVVEDTRGGIVTSRYVSVPDGVFAFTWNGQNAFGQAVADGRYVWKLSANDEAGNTARASGMVVLDTRKPITIIGVHPPRRTPARAATFGFRTNRPLDTFECSLDGNGWAPCRPGIRFAGLGTGAHLFRVGATDRARNRGPAAVWSWTVVSP